MGHICNIDLLRLLFNFYRCLYQCGKRFSMYRKRLHGNNFGLCNLCRAYTYRRIYKSYCHSCSRLRKQAFPFPDCKALSLYIWLHHDSYFIYDDLHIDFSVDVRDRYFLAKLVWVFHVQNDLVNSNLLDNLHDIPVHCNYRKKRCHDNGSFSRSFNYGGRIYKQGILCYTRSRQKSISLFADNTAPHDFWKYIFNWWLSAFSFFISARCVYLFLW